MRRSLLGVVAGVVFAAASPAGAQSPMSFQVRVDALFPTGDFGDVASAGASITGTAAVMVAAGIGVYGSYSHAEFELEERAGDLTDSGVSAGLIAALPLSTLGNGNPWWISGGLVFHGLDMESGGVSASAETDLGFEFSTGAAVAIAPGLRLLPALGYRFYDVSHEALGTDRVSYLTFGVGVHLGH